MDNTIYWDDDHFYSLGFLSDILGVKQSVLKKYVSKGLLKAEKRKFDKPIEKNGKTLRRERNIMMVSGTDLAGFLCYYYKNSHELVEAFTNLSERIADAFG